MWGESGGLRSNGGEGVMKAGLEEGGGGEGGWELAEEPGAAVGRERSGRRVVAGAGGNDGNGEPGDEEKARESGDG